MTTIRTTEALDLVIAGPLGLPGGAVPGEIGVRNGQIVALAQIGELSADHRIDAGDRLVLPGHVDVHVHTGSEPGEGITQATAAAAAGGVTTIVDMPYDASGPATSGAVLRGKGERVEAEAIVDVALFGTLRKEGGRPEIGPLIDTGAIAFKLSTFESDPVRFPRIPDGEIYLALAEMAEQGVLVAFHPENDDIVARLTAALAEQGRIDAPAHALARPPLAETEAIGRILEIARATNARVHLCHVSVGRGFELADRARADGVDVTAETCGHFLLLDDEAFVRLGTRAKTNPPLRRRDEVERLWQLLADGAIDIISSDHVGWPLRVKNTPSILDAKAGFPGLELNFSLLLSEGLARGLPLALLLKVLCENPARRFGLWPRKGGLVLGGDADLVIFDPKKRWRVDESTLVGHAGWSQYHGREVTGRVETVLLRGQVVADDGRVTGVAGAGRWLRPVERPIAERR